MSLWPTQLQEDGQGKIIGYLYRSLNTLDNKIQYNNIHYNIVKELWEYIESVYYGNDNLTQQYDMCQALFCMDTKGKTLSQIYIWV